MTSPDGATWTPQSHGTQNDLSDVAYGQGEFLAVTPSGTALLSTGGVLWPQETRTAFRTSLHGAAYGNGIFVAVGVGNLGALSTANAILTTVDGTSWTPQSTGTITSAGLNRVAYGGGRFVAVGFGGTVLTSTDGTSWASQSSGTLVNLYGVSYGNATYVAVGDVILSSSDGATWTQRSAPQVNYKAVTYDGTGFVAVGEQGTLVTSPDGTSWTERNTTTWDTLTSVAFGGGYYVAVGANGTLLTSRNGAAWRLRNIGIPMTPNSVIYGGGTFVVVGRGGLILQSANVLTPWARFESITAASDGTFHLPIEASVNSVLFVESSQDLSAWKPFMTVTNSTGTVEVSAPSIQTLSRRFFRVKQVSQ